jgi:hypothetical protein
MARKAKQAKDVQAKRAAAPDRRQRERPIEASVRQAAQPDRMRSEMKPRTRVRVVPQTGTLPIPIEHPQKYDTFESAEGSAYDSGEYVSPEGVCDTHDTHDRQPPRESVPEHTDFELPLSGESMIQAIIFNEILGKPNSMRPVTTYCQALSHTSPAPP